MNKLEVARLGEPILRQITKKVSKSKFTERKMQDFFDNLAFTLRQDDRAAGLAAPQVFEDTQIFAVQAFPNLMKDFKATAKVAPGEVMIIVNPRLHVVDETLVQGMESCLSFMELTGTVPRFRAIELHYKDREGNPQEMTAQGWFARLLQHEYDHLQGVLWLDRVKSWKEVYLQDVWEKLNRK